MNEQPRSPSQNRNDTKTLLSTLKWTTAIGAVSLTLAGWGLLSQADALNAAKVDQVLPAELASSAAGEKAALSITPGAITAAVAAATTSTVTTAPTTAPTAAATAIVLPTPTLTAAATAAATATPTAVPTAAPTATPAKLYTLDIVQWVENSNGDPWAVVRDDSGVLWYVWGPDVERIEQGLEPEYQPQPVNARGQSRAS
jgi:cell division septation protein DedD